MRSFIAAHERIHAPLRVRWGARAPTAEELLVLDLERADVPLDLIQSSSTVAIGVRKGARFKPTGG